MRPGTLFARSDDCDLKGCWSQATPREKHAPCCEIGFIGKVKGISKFVREQALPAFCAQLEELRVTIIGGLVVAADFHCHRFATRCGS
jgi:hypothetical protein